MNSSFNKLHNSNDDSHIRNPYQSLRLQKTYLKYPKLLPSSTFLNNSFSNNDILNTNGTDIMKTQFDIQNNSFSSTSNPSSPQLRNTLSNNSYSIKKAMIAAQKERMEYNKILGYLKNETMKEQKKLLENFSLKHAKRLNLEHNKNHNRNRSELGIECKLSQDKQNNSSISKNRSFSNEKMDSKANINKSNNSFSSIQNLIISDYNSEQSYKNYNKYQKNVNKSINSIDKIINKNNSLPLLLRTCKDNVNILLTRKKVNDLPIFPVPVCLFQNKYGSKSEEARYTNIINELTRLKNMIELDDKNVNKLVKEYLLYNHIEHKYITSSSIVNFTKFLFTDFWKVIAPNQSYKQFLIDVLNGKILSKLNKKRLPRNKSMIEMTNYVSPFIKEYKNTFVKKNFNVKILNDINENLDKQTFFRKKLAFLKKQIPLSPEEEFKQLQNDINLGVKPAPNYIYEFKQSLSKEQLNKNNTKKSPNTFFITSDKNDTNKSTYTGGLINKNNNITKTQLIDYQLKKTVEDFRNCIHSYSDLKKYHKITEYGVLNILKKKLLKSYGNKMLKS